MSGTVLAAAALGLALVFYLRRRGGGSSGASSSAGDPLHGMSEAEALAAIAIEGDGSGRLVAIGDKIGAFGERIAAGSVLTLSARDTTRSCSRIGAENRSGKWGVTDSSGRWSEVTETRYWSSLRRMLTATGRKARTSHGELYPALRGLTSSEGDYTLTSPDGMSPEQLAGFIAGFEVATCQARMERAS